MSGGCMEEIIKKVVNIYAGRILDTLTTQEEELVKLLEKGGYIIPNNPANGFVGNVAPAK
jgi:hypothetical protein